MVADGGPWLRGLREAGRSLLQQPRAASWIAPAAWMGLLWWSSARPAEPDPGRGVALSFGWNLAHAPAFGVLALLLLPLAPRVGGWACLGARELVSFALVAVGYGVIDEWHQSRVPGRHASAYDVITDAVGVLCVLWIAAYVGREEAHEAGVRRRLLLGFALCLTAAAGTTFLLPGP